MKGKRAKRAVFWLTVAGVAVVADIGLMVASNHINSPGLARLTHKMGGH